MNNQGHIFEVDEEKQLIKDMKGKFEQATKEKIASLTKIPEEFVEKVKAMNRKERRAWLKEYKKENK